jgi:hypothetical protein
MWYDISTGAMGEWRMYKGVPDAPLVWVRMLVAVIVSAYFN